MFNLVVYEITYKPTDITDISKCHALSMTS